MSKTQKDERDSARRGAYATSADFEQIFTEDVTSFYLLSLLLTGSAENAEKCFVAGFEESRKANYVFKEWARSWARRTIIQSAIRLIAHMDKSQTVSPNADVTWGVHKIPAILEAEVDAILELAPSRRFVFVMSVLERYSDNDCSILLGYTRREVATLRSRAMQELGMLLRFKYSMECSSDGSEAPENIATLTTPLIAQYFAASGWAGSMMQP